MERTTEEPQVGDKVILVTSFTDEQVYVLGHSFLNNLMPNGTIFVVGDKDGNAMPINAKFLCVAERSDITRARAKRMKESLLQRCNLQENDLFSEG